MTSMQLYESRRACQAFGRARPRTIGARLSGCRGLQSPLLIPHTASCLAPSNQSLPSSEHNPLDNGSLPSSANAQATSLADHRGRGALWTTAAAAVLAASLALALPADAIVPTADTAVLSIPGIVGDSPLREGLVSGFLLIFFSEIGDKTFFIALLLALKQPKGLVFTGTFGALAVMTVISVLLGQVLHQVDELVPGNANLPYDDLLAVALLLYFGVKTLQDAKDADESAAEEKEEAKEVVDGLKANGQDALRLVLTTFALVFTAEWGDKSFLATIALAAASSPLGVTAGAVAGHGVATGLAVAGGGFLSRYFSERVLQYVGGSLFLVFAAATVVDLIV